MITLSHFTHYIIASAYFFLPLHQVDVGGGAKFRPAYKEDYDGIGYTKQYNQWWIQGYGSVFKKHPAETVENSQQTYHFFHCSDQRIRRSRN